MLANYYFLYKQLCLFVCVQARKKVAPLKCNTLQFVKRGPKCQPPFLFALFLKGCICNFQKILVIIDTGGYLVNCSQYPVACACISKLTLASVAHCLCWKGAEDFPWKNSPSSLT